MRVLVALLLIVGALGSSACSPPGPTANYWQDVQPILEGRCVTCHYEGGIGGFALDSYSQASTWRDAIAATTSAGSMPPWPAGRSE